MLTHRLLLTTSLIAIAMFAHPAAAQSVPAADASANGVPAPAANTASTPAATARDASDTGDIVVTGSRIARSGVAGTPPSRR